MNEAKVVFDNVDFISILKILIMDIYIPNIGITNHLIGKNKNFKFIISNLSSR